MFTVGWLEHWPVTGAFFAFGLSELDTPNVAVKHIFWFSLRLYSFAASVLSFVQRCRPQHVCLSVNEALLSPAWLTTQRAHKARPIRMLTLHIRRELASSTSLPPPHMNDHDSWLIIPSRPVSPSPGQLFMKAEPGAGLTSLSPSLSLLFILHHIHLLLAPSSVFFNHRLVAI